MDFLTNTFLGNTLLQWIGAALVIVLTLIVMGLIQRFLVKRMRKLTDATHTELDGLALDLVANTRWWSIFFVALYFGTLPLVFPTDTVNDVLRAAAIIAALIQVALWGNQIIEFLLKRYIEGEPKDDVSGQTAYSLLKLMLRIVLWSIVVLMALDNIPGIEVTSLIAGLGVSSIAIALAVQTILGDIFASLSIVLDKPFVVGDSIEVGDYMGTVEHIGLKTTRVRSLTGEELIFANSDLLESRIRNYRRMHERRSVLTLGVAYETPPDVLENVPQMIQSVIDGVENVRFGRAHLKEMGSSTLNYEVVYWVLTPDYNDYMDTLQAINIGLLRRFGEAGINMPYPTQHVYIERTGITEPHGEPA